MALVPMVPAVISLAGTIAALIVAIATRIGASEVLRWKITVSGSGVSMVSMLRKFERAAAAVASSRMRVNDAFTSAEVACDPLVNLALWSSLKVSVLPSAGGARRAAGAGAAGGGGGGRAGGA